MLLCYEMAYPDDGKGFWTIISTTIHGLDFLSEPFRFVNV